MIKVLPAVCLMFLMFSCSDNPQDTNQPTRLVKVTEYDDSPVPSDYDTYAYDSQGRVEHISTDNGAHQIAHFYYSGNDTKPFKMDGESNESTNFFDYNSEGKLLRDSSTNIYNQYINVADYSYLGNAVIYRRRNFEIASGIWTDSERDTLYLDVSNRVVQAKIYTSFSGSLKLSKVESFTYDNKINPLGNLNIGFLNKLGSGAIETIIGYSNFQVNNCTRIQTTYYDLNGNISDTDDISYNCTYNSNNYIQEFSYVESGYPIRINFTYE